jgi:hypothetical protein
MILVNSVLEKLYSSWHRVAKSTTNLQILSNSTPLSSRSQCTINPYFTHYDYSRGFYYVRRSVPLGYNSDHTKDQEVGLVMTSTTGFTSAVHSQESAFRSFHGHLRHRNSISPRNLSIGRSKPMRSITPFSDNVPAVGTL